jgi:redox-sensitive bicupin YhaK (pirin superfamily)
MPYFRPAALRGHADFGWLDSRHSFSFGEYHDPAQMGFGALRVINEDRVAPGGGFDTHGHRDMEIVSYVLAGALEHRDSLGTGAVIRPGEVQRMTAGTGIRHSEFNHSKQDPVHFLQIWIVPERTGLAPGYEQKAFAPAERQDRLRLLASRDGRDGSVIVHQDADLWGTTLAAGRVLPVTVRPGRKVWLQAVRGDLNVSGTGLGGGQAMAAGDGLGLDEAGTLAVTATTESEFLLFDLGA